MLRDEAGGPGPPPSPPTPRPRAHVRIRTQRVLLPGELRCHSGVFNYQLTTGVKRV